MKSDRKEGKRTTTSYSRKEKDLASTPPLKERAKEAYERKVFRTLDTMLSSGGQSRGYFPNFIECKKRLSIADKHHEGSDRGPDHKVSVSHRI